MGLARSTVQRIVAALAAEDFVAEAQPGHGVRIGPGLARIAASLSSNYGEILIPHLVALRDEVRETVDLSLLRRLGRVHRPDSRSAAPRRALRHWRAFPLHCTANGKAILAGFSKDDAAVLVAKSVAEHPEHQLVDRAKLFREADAIRRRHLAFDLGEHGAGISAVGFAVRDAFGKSVAVSIPAPTQRFNAQRNSLAQALLAFREKLRAIVG